MIINTTTVLDLETHEIIEQVDFENDIIEIFIYNIFQLNGLKCKTLI